MPKEALILRLVMLVIDVIEKAAANADDATLETAQDAVDRLEKARDAWYGDE